LRQSILKQAFEGKLVKQNDSPAKEGTASFAVQE